MVRPAMGPGRATACSSSGACDSGLGVLLVSSCSPAVSGVFALAGPLGATLLAATTAVGAGALVRPAPEAPADAAVSPSGSKPIATTLTPTAAATVAAPAAAIRGR